MKLRDTLRDSNKRHLHVVEVFVADKTNCLSFMYLDELS